MSGSSPTEMPGRICEFASYFIGTKCSINYWPTNSDLSSIDYESKYVIGLVNIEKNNNISYWSWGNESYFSNAKSRFGNGVHGIFVLDR